MATSLHAQSMNESFTLLRQRIQRTLKRLPRIFVERGIGNNIADDRLRGCRNQQLPSGWISVLGASEVDQLADIVPLTQA